MSKKRDRLEIIRDILLAVREKRGKVRPTHILYKSNLSHQSLTEYLRELLLKEFLIETEDVKGKKTYDLTDKGFKFLEEYSVIQGFIDSYGLQ
ncbi:MAG: winged helix-turn-helix domain-containing protein [archaeon]